MEMTFADVCRNARDYCDAHFQHERGFNDVMSARQADEEINKSWQEMFDKYVSFWEGDDYRNL
jgi:hypothetical protein